MRPTDEPLEGEAGTEPEPAAETAPEPESPSDPDEPPELHGLQSNHNEVRLRP